MGAGKRGPTPRKRSQYWPADAIDPRSLVDRPCRFNPDLFTSDSTVDQKVAKMSCEGCPQRVSCLEHGLTLDERVDKVVWASGSAKGLIPMHGTEGIWGGMTRRERIKYRRKSS